MSMLEVLYKNTKVNKQRLEKTETISKPVFCIKEKNNKYYTLIMVDPDAPDPEWLHWLIINIKDGNQKELIGYSPPTPPWGVHRYFFLLCEQKDRLSLNNISVRSKFNTRKFIKDNKLVKIDSTFFTVKK